MAIGLSRWSSEGDNSEIESKDSFQKHYSGRGSSDWSGSTERLGERQRKKGEKGRCFILWMRRAHNNGVFIKR